MLNPFGTTIANNKTIDDTNCIIKGILITLKVISIYANGSIVQLIAIVYENISLLVLELSWANEVLSFAHEKIIGIL